MYALALSKYQINIMHKLCESIVKDPTIRFSKNQYKVELRNACYSIIEDLDYALANSCLDDEEGE